MSLCPFIFVQTCKLDKLVTKDSDGLISYPLGSSIINLDDVVDSRANDLIRSVVERHGGHLIATLQVVNESFSSRVPNFDRAVVRCGNNKRISSSRGMNSIDDSLVPCLENVSKFLLNRDQYLHQFIIRIPGKTTDLRDFNLSF